MNRDIIVKNIHWVIEDENGNLPTDYEAERLALNLPDMLTLTVDEEDLEDEGYIADVLSDRFGFLIESLEVAE